MFSLLFIESSQAPKSEDLLRLLSIFAILSNIPYFEGVGGAENNISSVLKMINRFGRKRLSESLSRARHQPGDDDPTPNRVLQRQHGDRDTSNRGEDAVSTLSTSQQVVCATTSLATVLLASGLLGTSMWSQSVTRRSLRANSTLHSAAGQASRRVGAITPLAIFPLCIRRNVYNALHACTC